MSKLDEERLSEIKAAANRASPGKWFTWCHDKARMAVVVSDGATRPDSNVFGDDREYYRGRLVGESIDAADRNYLVVVQPSVALELVAEVRSLRLQIARLEEDLERAEKAAVF